MYPIEIIQILSAGRVASENKMSEFEGRFSGERLNRYHSRVVGDFLKLDMGVMLMVHLSKISLVI